MEVVEFLRENWQFISSCILIVLAVITMIIKKRSNYNVYDYGVTSKALELIIEAEKIFGPGRGSEKLEYVTSHLAEKFTEYDVPEVAFRSIVESILSSPQKKESADEKVK